MKDTTYNIVVTDLQKRITVNALMLLKERQIAEGKNFDMIDDLIVKVCDAPLTKEKNRKIYEVR